jgi:hypothetical protein
MPREERASGARDLAGHALHTGNAGMAARAGFAEPAARAGIDQPITMATPLLATRPKVFPAGKSTIRPWK